MQYQKLMDSRSADRVAMTASLDPQLGMQLLIHGVIHCLPFLAKLLQPKLVELCDVTDVSLREGGVRDPTNRTAILTAIEEYLRNKQTPPTIPSRYPVALDDGDMQAANNINETIPEGESADLGSECVVCMEQSVSYFQRVIYSLICIYLFVFSAKLFSCLVVIFAAAKIVKPRLLSAQCVVPKSIGEFQ